MSDHAADAIPEIRLGSKVFVCEICHCGVYATVDLNAASWDNVPEAVAHYDWHDRIDR